MSALSDAYEQIHDGQLTCFDSDLLTINSVNYAVAGGELVQSNELAIGGLIDEPMGIVSVKASLFTTAPALQTRCTYRGKTFKIDKIRSSPDGTVLTFDLLPTK